jgi:KDO2-lipid IV(A) lauroyltransferase
MYLFAYLPLPVIHGIGTCAGWGLILLPNRSRKTTEINIALCWPDLSTQQRRKLVRKSLIETGKTILETGALWLRPGNHTLRLIKQVDGIELVNQAMAGGTGVVLATPHLGAWEGAGLYCAAKFNITCLYRPLKFPDLEQLIQTARGRLGGNYVPTNAGGIRAIYRGLAQGGVVAMLPDQEPKSGTGRFAPLFGVPAYSMVFLARLAAKSKTPVIFVWCERLSWGRGYHLHFRATSPATCSSNLDEAVPAMNKAVEACIRECPEQYQWSYRRFKTRPAGEQSVYRSNVISGSKSATL